MNNNTDDVQWMSRAKGLALNAWGQTSPNPIVGAIVVNGGNHWEGWHQKAGEAHAEINALQVAGKAACGATLFVTLEPCSTQGRTPPCTQAILDAGVRRVVIGALDPNPNHAGNAVAILEREGVQVTVGVEATACERLNESFNCWVRHKRPYVLLKMAMTLDGKIATRDGSSQWITGSLARAEVQRLRRWSDAIMVGGETVRRDNPQLLVRDPEEWQPQPLRLVATRSGQLGERPSVLTDGQAETRLLNCVSRGDWVAQLEKLGNENITSLLVEGGGGLAAELLQHGLVDKVAFFIAPKILTGAGSRPVVGGKDPSSLADALPLTETEMTRVGEDFLITGYLTDVHRYS